MTNDDHTGPGCIYVVIIFTHGVRPKKTRYNIIWGLVDHYELF